MKILIVGEFMSHKDREGGALWSDPSAMLWKSWLKQSGIEPRHCQFEVVIPEPGNSLLHFLGPKEEGRPGVRSVMRGKYLRKEFFHHVEALWAMIHRTKPNLVIAAGDLPLWALTTETSIKAARGRITLGNSAIPQQKVLPTYSARQVIMEWPLRPILLADLGKARREAEFPEVRRPQRFIHLPECVEDLEAFAQEYIPEGSTLSVDIETKQTLITCVGFAPDHTRALVVPFFCEAHSDGNFWRTKREEYIAWQFVRRMLREHCSFGQNFQYDMQYLWRQMGIKAPRFLDDTMLLHHALQPEMQKGLGFLASIYTDELGWKFMHKQSSTDKTAKKGDVE